MTFLEKLELAISSSLVFVYLLLFVLNLGSRHGAKAIYWLGAAILTIGVTRMK